MLDLDDKTKLKFYYEAICLSEKKEDREPYWQGVEEIAKAHPEDIEEISNLRLAAVFELINKEIEKQGLEKRNYVAIKPEQFKKRMNNIN